MDRTSSIHIIYKVIFYYILMDKNLLKNNKAKIIALAESCEIDNNFKEAIKHYYTLDQNDPYILNKIGTCYYNLNNMNLAIKYFERILPMINHVIPDLLNNIGKCYAKLKDYDNSLKYYLLSIKHEKKKETYKILGDLYFYIKKYDESIKCFEKADNNYITLYNKSFSYLANKKFTKGLELYENRLLNNFCYVTNTIARVEIPNIDYWDGIKKCSRLLVVYEQGIGDNIQYYRFIIELSIKYPDMIIDYFCTDIVRNLFEIYNNINIIDTVVLQLYDYKLYIMSLPKILNVNDENVIKPNKINYIKYNEEKLNYWNEKLSVCEKLKVGIVYKGLLNSFIDKDIPIKYFKKLSELNIDLICLHKKKQLEEDISSIDFKMNFYDLDNDKAFEDTICILKNLDLLITIDTSILHIAGVMNINTWLLLGYGSDWRWSYKDDNFWYDSVQLIRMKENKPLFHILEVVYDKLIKII